MARLDHLAIPVSNLVASREWYAAVFGLEFEFENEMMVSLKDDSDLSLFLGKASSPPQTAGFGLWFQVDDVAAFHSARSAAGVTFVCPPQPSAWGYGAELRDPDGYPIYVWDEKSMAAHS